MALAAPPSPIIPKVKDLKISDIDPLEVARQLTLIEFSLYKKVRPAECLQRTREPSSAHSQDSIAAVIRLNTKVCQGFLFVLWYINLATTAYQLGRGICPQ